MKRLAIVVVAALALTLSVSSAAGQNRSDLKNYQHVWVIMMENTGYDALIGNPNAPWINEAAGTYGLATNYFGVIIRVSRITSRTPQDHRQRLRQ